jgi:hypothetical protein
LTFRKSAASIAQLIYPESQSILRPPSYIGCLGYYLSDETSSARLPDVFLSSQDVCAQHLATMRIHFATVAGSLHEVLEPLVRWRVEWEGGSGLCMLRTDGVMAV